jgi:nucleoside permease NupC
VEQHFTLGVSPIVGGAATGITFSFPQVVSPGANAFCMHQLRGGGLVFGRLLSNHLQYAGIIETLCQMAKGIHAFIEPVVAQDRIA